MHVFISLLIALLVTLWSNCAVAEKRIVIDPRKGTWVAYSSGDDVVRSGRASLGKAYCPDVKRACRTVTGTYRIYSKGGPSCKSTRFPLPHGGAPMPYCMHFYKGFAIHGSNDVPRHNASHGCVRVPVSDARWLNQSFTTYGTKVVIKSY